MTLQHLDLCSGIGGFALAARMVGGYATRAFVEIDPFCRRVLAKNLPGVPAFEDIHDVTSQTLRRAGLWRTDLVTAGFPCQPWSAAGRRAGEADRRHLWPEVLRVVADTRPAWFLGENVRAIVRPYLDRLAADLESLGYAVWPVVVPACAVGAPHRRERLWLVAHADEPGSQERPDGRRAADAQCTTALGSGVVADALGVGQREPDDEADALGSGRARAATCRRGGRLAQSGVCGGAHGVPAWLHGRWPAGWGDEQHDWEPPRTAKDVRDRAKRLGALGNAIVPQVAAVFLDAIRCYDPAASCPAAAGGGEVVG